MLLVIPLIVLLGALLGVARSRALLRADSRYMLATAHRHLPELLVLVPLAILATLALMFLLRSYQLTWYLPVAIDRWRDLILWILSGGIFSYLAGISAHISFARREPERVKRAFCWSNIPAPDPTRMPSSCSLQQARHCESWIH
ncbi:MAG: hypothetical protein H7831_15280 [Magnetococcus sp. WYHC-3]